MFLEKKNQACFVAFGCGFWNDIMQYMDQKSEIITGPTKVNIYVAYILNSLIN